MANAIIVITALCLMSCRYVTESTFGDAPEAAKQWAQDLGIKVQAVKCMSQDSDGDGYVSCTVAEKTPRGSQVHAVECAAALTLGHEGCRVARAR